MLEDLIAEIRRVVRAPKCRHVAAAACLETDDLASMVVVKVLEKHPAFENEEHRRRWITRTARHTAIDELRKRARTTEMPAGHEPEDHEPSPVDRLIDKHEAEVRARDLRWIIGWGPALEVIEGSTWSAAAEKRGVAVSTLTRRRDRLLERIRKERAGAQMSLFSNVGGS